MYNYSRPTSLGIDERWERVLCYAFLWVGGLVLLFLEQKNETVRLHAKQSILIFGPLTALAWLAGAFGHVLGGIWFIGLLFSVGFGLIHWLAWLAIFVLWILLMVMAYTSARTLFVGPRHDRML
jgi:uncharacterized membrane protein